jgi:hypothetical protein
MLSTALLAPGAARSDKCDARVAFEFKATRASLAVWFSTGDATKRVAFGQVFLRRRDARVALTP